MNKNLRNGGNPRLGEVVYDLKDLVDEEQEQIIISNELFMAFVKHSKGKKYFDACTAYSLFKYVVCMYNDTVDLSDDAYDALTYLERISNLLDYINIPSIMELSITQLNLLLDENNGESVVNTYLNIKKNRHTLTKADFDIFYDMVKNTKCEFSKREINKEFKYISSLYNSNPILQDNVNYIEYLEAFSTLSLFEATSLRMCQIIDMFKISTTLENVSEEKLLINDLAII